MMVKNEEESIKVSLESTKNYFDTIIIFDTGSTDNTVDIIKKTCQDNKQTLHLKQGEFKSFPESRNEAIEFAEQKSTHAKFFLLMDAGDEFKTDMTSTDFQNMFDSIPEKYAFDIGIIKQKWLDDKGKENISDHFDCRLIKNHKKIRYDLRYPVHEQVCNADTLVSSNFGDHFYLYQDRVKYGGSTKNRYKRDIELLLKAYPNKRNLYFLAQSFMSIDDYKNGYKYNVLSYQCKDTSNNDDIFTLVRIAFCAIQIKLIPIAIKYLEILLKMDEPPVDAYVYMLDIHIKNNQCDKVIKYVKKLYHLEKPSPTSNIKLINHYFYDYLRFNLISIVCLMCNKELEIGKKACLKAVAFNRPDDLHNIQVYNRL